MNVLHITKIANEQGLKSLQVQAVATLLQEGATIPFIARYRKEATGSLDEIAITSVRDRLDQLKELDDRKEYILKSLEQHGHLTDELKEKVLSSETLAVLEDIYLPYKPKRRTKATIAREKGLEPLALAIFEQKGIDPNIEAAAYINQEKGVESVEEALSGARDIIAEMVNENEQIRSKLRELFFNKGKFVCKVIPGKEEEGIKYKDYFEWEEPVNTAPSHRVLAMRRGENEEILSLAIEPPINDALDTLENFFIKGNKEDSNQVKLSVHDSYKRLLSRSMETEARLNSKQNADSYAIRIFADNLRELLLSPPLGSKRVLGVDPGFRTGCKIVCLDRQGKLLHNDTIYPLLSDKEVVESAKKIMELCKRFKIEAIAVGNGTGGRETESFIKKLPLPKEIKVVMVNESGASIYSASEVARSEFPDLDLTVRGAVSIGRRLMDPLSELVKIDPKSIGVGQYQHDVDQSALRKSLDDVVISCVNKVGVDLNRASVELLTYVSGLGPSLAKNIVNYRNENGAFKSRDELREVPRLGPKAYEQCAGFLRIIEGENPLDASAVHPESYHIVGQMAKDLECTIQDLLKESQLRAKIELKKYISDKIGLPTLNDILEELAKPGRDPRKEFDDFSFASGIEKIDDLKIGTKLPGIVTNVTAFGAFIDIGVHQDGLAHVSELSDQFIKDPAQILKVHQRVTATVIDIDIPRKRISLSLKTNPSINLDKNHDKKSEPKKMKLESKKDKNRDKDKPFNNPFADFFSKTK
ncbi:MAG: RNA-binding transcriptional accessory protein [Desulfobacterales bacterium]|nr:RNA-binding transcriptional accessory protein [Desulfobacterales bacterium]MBF0395970.1 RNA-binding transcriptional accessory protein [Desulfobacterales bacterium]